MIAGNRIRDLCTWETVSCSCFWAHVFHNGVTEDQQWGEDGEYYICCTAGHPAEERVGASKCVFPSGRWTMVLHDEECRSLVDFMVSHPAKTMEPNPELAPWWEHWNPVWLYLVEVVGAVVKGNWGVGLFPCCLPSLIWWRMEIHPSSSAIFWLHLQQCSQPDRLDRGGILERSECNSVSQLTLHV